MLSHGIHKSLKSLFGIVVPGLAGKICNIRISVIFYQVIDKFPHCSIVVREDRREVFALLVDKYDRTLAAFVDHLFNTVCKTRGLEGICHNGNRVKRLKRNQREYRSLTGLSSEIILIFEIAAEYQDVRIMLKRLTDKSLDKLSLIVFISLG